ncbi:MAG: beta-ketoacyl-ACP synthase III [Eubacteriales bacterium]|nr:beta-ketoacyl-ACP synthase III [Eubacteriales bacterium]
MTTRILGTGSALPKTTWTNDDLSAFIDTSDEWIRTRTGIIRRQIAAREESAASLGAEAGRKAIENSGTALEEIEMILAATCSDEGYFPSAACRIQAELGVRGAVCMDINAACSGFLFALHTAHAYVQSGIYQKILVIGTETMSRVIDWKDRSTCVLFGDGAGACVVGKDEKGILGFSQYSDGSRGSVLTGTAATLATPGDGAHPAGALFMDGQAVFRFAVKTVPECIQDTLEKTGKNIHEIDLFVLHQANSRIIHSVAKRLGAPEEKFPINLNEHGNTSAASIPILLDELNREGRLERGSLIMLAGFGAGLTWGTALLEW